MNGPLSGTLLQQPNGLTATEFRLVASAIVVAVVAIGLVAARFLRREARDRFPHRVADVVLTAAIGMILFVAGVSLLSIWGLVDEVVAAWERIGGTVGTGFKAMLALVVLGSAYVATGFLRRAVNQFVEGHEAITRHQSEIIYRISQLTLYVTAGAIVLGLWDVDLSGLLVGAGFLGIIVGMAARQTLGALLAGFVLMFSRPFEIGDWIEIDDQEGIVTDISIVNTRIQTFAGEYVMIPNDIVSGTEIINKSRKGRLRVEVDVGVDYEADVERAAEIAADAMDDVDEILSVPSPQVITKEFGDSAIVLGLRFWIDNPSSRRRWRARTAIIEAVKAEFDREGIKIPYPQRELAGREETSGFRIGGEQSRPEATADGGAGDDEVSEQ